MKNACMAIVITEYKKSGKGLNRSSDNFQHNLEQESQPTFDLPSRDARSVRDLPLDLVAATKRLNHSISWMSVSATVLQLSVILDGRQTKKYFLLLPETGASTTLLRISAVKAPRYSPKA